MNDCQVSKQAQTQDIKHSKVMQTQRTDSKLCNNQLGTSTQTTDHNHSNSKLKSQHCACLELPVVHLPCCSDVGAIVEARADTSCRHGRNKTLDNKAMGNDTTQTNEIRVSGVSGGRCASDTLHSLALLTQSATNSCQNTNRQHTPTQSHKHTSI